MLSVAQYRRLALSLALPPGCADVKLRTRLTITRRALSTPFVIARGTQQWVDVFTVQLQAGRAIGKGEAVASRSLGETPAIVAQVLRDALAQRRLAALVAYMDAAAPLSAVGALDCALWDLAAKQARRRVWSILGIPAPLSTPIVTTLSIGRPADVAAAARRVAPGAVLKIKLGPGADTAGIEAVRRAEPTARIVVDANGSWDEQTYTRVAPELAELNVELVEQPLAPGLDHRLVELPRPVALCADESAAGSPVLAHLSPAYTAINIKAGKFGGFSGALAAALQARASGLKIMLGCSVSTSLAIAPMQVLTPLASYADLDGPTFLARDRHASIVRAGRASKPARALWG